MLLHDFKAGDCVQIHPECRGAADYNNFTMGRNYRIVRIEEGTQYITIYNDNGNECHWTHQKLVKMRMPEPAPPKAAGPKIDYTTIFPIWGKFS